MLNFDLENSIKIYLVRKEDRPYLFMLSEEKQGRRQQNTFYPDGGRFREDNFLKLLI